MDVSWHLFLSFPNLARWICLEVGSHVLCINIRSIVRRSLNDLAVDGTLNTTNQRIVRHAFMHISLYTFGALN